MEKKKRYCPSCGSKTNDRECSICGRRTKIISSRHEESDLSILVDDVASDVELHAEEEIDEQIARQEVVKKKSSRTKMILMIPIYIILAVMAILLGTSQTPLEEEEVEDYHDLTETDMLFYDTDELSMDMISVNTQDKYAIIQNNTPWELYFTYDDEEYWDKLLPYEYIDDIRSSQVEDLQLAYANEYIFALDDINYTLYYTNEYEKRKTSIKYDVYIDEALEEDEYMAIGETIMTYLLNRDEFYDPVELNFKNKETKEAYEKVMLYLDTLWIRMGDKMVQYE
ncbi:MAG: hypothetical protein UIM26_07875 [Longicatena sp.]|nr:hypothetical protein [Longicatena sp.]